MKRHLWLGMYFAKYLISTVEKGRLLSIPESENRHACGGGTPACRNACLPTGRHLGVQARGLARGGYTLPCGMIGDQALQTRQKRAT